MTATDIEKINAMLEPLREQLALHQELLTVQAQTLADMRAGLTEARQFMVDMDERVKTLRREVPRK